MIKYLTSIFLATFLMFSAVAEEIYITHNSVELEISDGDEPFSVNGITVKDSKEVISQLAYIYSKWSLEERPTLIIRNRTKALQHGEEFLKKEIKTLSTKWGFRIVHMPYPTGNEPPELTEIRKLTHKWREQEKKAVQPVLNGDKLKIEFPEDVRKAFGDQVPLSVKAVRKNGWIDVELTNTSKKHVVVTREPAAYSYHYLKANGANLGGPMGVIPFSPKEFLSHVVIQPIVEGRSFLKFSSKTVFKIPEDHKLGCVCVLDLSLSGYFPEIEKYATFSVSGQVDVKTIKVEAEDEEIEDAEPYFKEAEEEK